VAASSVTGSMPYDIREKNYQYCLLISGRDCNLLSIRKAYRVVAVDNESPTSIAEPVLKDSRTTVYLLSAMRV